MFALDTHVVSALMRECPQPEILAWMGNQLTDTLFATAVAAAEVRTGIAVLPGGGRQHGPAAAAERVFDVFLAGRILPFDSDAA